MSGPIQTEVAVLGSGPGGYSAAFRLADLGKKVVLIERYDVLGGVCLNVGCIPSKALLHVAKVITEAKALGQQGVMFGQPSIDLPQLSAWKDTVVKQLTGGLKLLASRRKVQKVQGHAQFVSPHELVVQHQGTEQRVLFEQCVIAAGSTPAKLPFIPDDPRVMDSTTALDLEEAEIDMLVLGGGIIGLEMATVYQALGARISVVEMMDQIIPGADPDVVAPLHKRIVNDYEHIMLKTSVSAVEAKEDGLWVTFTGENVPAVNPKRFDRMLVAVGRRPNGKQLGVEQAGVQVSDRGFIPVDRQMKTNVPHIFAIGDIAGEPMLAHKASTEGRLAAEVIAGQAHYFDARCIPSVAYTDPEVAWVGMAEGEAKSQGVPYKLGVFPWMASGRALSSGRAEGLTKLVLDQNGVVIGGGIVGVNAGELIAEIALAIEMGCTAEDVALTIHPHPTLSESVMMAAEVYGGTITDL